MVLRHVSINSSHAPVISLNSRSSSSSSHALLLPVTQKTLQQQQKTRRPAETTSRPRRFKSLLLLCLICDSPFQIVKLFSSVSARFLIKGLSSVAGDLDIKVGLKHKKINISNSRVAWEHEQFSRLRITAATLSELSTAPRLLESTGGLSDVRLHSCYRCLACWVYLHGAYEQKTFFFWKGS